MELLLDFIFMKEKEIIKTISSYHSTVEDFVVQVISQALFNHVIKEVFRVLVPLKIANHSKISIMMAYFLPFHKKIPIFMIGRKSSAFIVMELNIMEVDLNLFNTKTSYYILEELITPYNS
jgi:hypothetical protein